MGTAAASGMPSIFTRLADAGIRVGPRDAPDLGTAVIEHFPRPISGLDQGHPDCRRAVAAVTIET
ncbi:hypothetical protein GCM10023083_05480 [Streptomyces phyllanthi]